jgi:hypothetical protein
MTRSITFTNSKNETVTLGRDKPYILTNVMGIGELDAELVMQTSPIQDGSNFERASLQSRIMSFEVGVMGDTKDEVYKHRQHLAKVFNPKLGEGVLMVTIGEESKEIRVVADGTPTFIEESGRRYHLATINLIAPDPYWLSVAESEEQLLSWIGEFRFPLRFPTKFGRQGDTKTVTNDGDVEAPITIYFKGPALNPVVRNLTTGESIKVNRRLLEGERLRITTGFGNKRVDIFPLPKQVRNTQNLFPKFTDAKWVKHANATVTDDVLTLNATGADQYTEITFDAVENDQFTIYVPGATDQHRIYFGSWDSNDKYITGSAFSNGTGEIRSYTAYPNTRTIKVRLSSTVAGVFLYENITLTKGTSPLSYWVEEEQEPQNVMNWIDLDSTFFTLEPGENELQYGADEGKETADVQVRWKNRYISI